MAYSGKFQPKNPKKYKGNLSNIVYRSSWEARCMSYFDKNENVIWWSSEEIIVPYRSPVDGKVHRYYPDFIIKVKQKDGGIKTIMIEIKPEYQKKEPKVQRALKLMSLKKNEFNIFWIAPIASMVLATLPMPFGYFKLLKFIVSAGALYFAVNFF